MNRKNKMNCKSCGCDIIKSDCDKYGCKTKGTIKHAEFPQRCLDCHNELVHGEIQNHNIHVCGGTNSHLEGLDKDPDAFKRSDSFFTENKKMIT